MKPQPTYEHVRPFRWVATQLTGGKDTYDAETRTVTVPVTGYCAVAPLKFLAARRLRGFLAEQGVAA